MEKAEKFPWFSVHGGFYLTPNHLAVVTKEVKQLNHPLECRDGLACCETVTCFKIQQNPRFPAVYFYALPLYSICVHGDFAKTYKNLNDLISCTDRSLFYWYFTFFALYSTGVHFLLGQTIPTTQRATSFHFKRLNNYKNDQAFLLDGLLNITSLLIYYITGLTWDNQLIRKHFHQF